MDDDYAPQLVTVTEVRQTAGDWVATVCPDYYPNVYLYMIIPEDLLNKYEVGTKLWIKILDSMLHTMALTNPPAKEEEEDEDTDRDR